MKKVKLGVTNLSFHKITASLVTNVLNDFGFEVERKYFAHEENFEKLKLGEIDMLSSAWLPSSHGKYKENVEKSVKLIQLGLHYKPYAFWGVPDFVPEDRVKYVSDLLKEEVYEKMNLNIQGINPGAGISRFSLKIIKEYGLDKVGFKFFHGSEKECFDAFENAYKSRSWCVVPLWWPQFLHYKYKIRELIEPNGFLGTVDEAVLLLRDDKKNMFSENDIKTLDNLKFSNEIISKLDYFVSKENQDIDTVTKNWLNENFNI